MAANTNEPAGSPDPPFRDRVYDMVRSIPRGRVASYGAVAAAVGQPRAARAVGRALRELDLDQASVPWWRVVNAAGAVAIRGAFHDASVQRSLLEAEGVRFGASGRVDWRRVAWGGSEQALDTAPGAPRP